MSLRSLPEGFGALPLKELELRGCDKLTLPESFIQLQLSDDNFMKCCKQVARLPESIVEHHLFKDATSLDFSSAKLVALPERFGEMKLTELNMGHCNNLNHEEALEIIIKIDTLTSLNLTSWKMSLLPEGFEKLVNLETLNLSFCKSLLSLPAGFVQHTITLT